MTTLNINEVIIGFHGDGEMYRHSFSKKIYTSGVQYIAETYECYWLIDAIFSHQLYEHVRAQPFQSWVLRRIRDFKFLLRCTDGNDNYITQQVIPFSDFKGDEITIWFVNDTMLLPSEY